MASLMLGTMSQRSGQSAYEGLGYAKLSPENLAAAAEAFEVDPQLFSKSSSSSSHSAPNKQTPEEAFLQHCQQQIAQIVAASPSCDGINETPALPMLSRMANLPPETQARMVAALRQAGAQAESATTGAEASDHTGRKRDWQACSTVSFDLPHTELWHKGSIEKRAKPELWLPPPEPRQPLEADREMEPIRHAMGWRDRNRYFLAGARCVSRTRASFGPRTVGGPSDR